MGGGGGGGGSRSASPGHRGGCVKIRKSSVLTTVCVHGGAGAVASLQAQVIRGGCVKIRKSSVLTTVCVHGGWGGGGSRSASPGHPGGCVKIRKSSVLTIEPLTKDCPSFHTRLFFFFFFFFFGGGGWSGFTVILKWLWRCMVSISWRYDVCRYSEADQYLCKRILASSGKNWSQEVAKAHKVCSLLFCKGGWVVILRLNWVWVWSLVLYLRWPDAVGRN